MKKIKLLVLGIISLWLANSVILVAQFDQPGFLVHSVLAGTPNLLFFNLGFNPGDSPIPFPANQNNRFEVYGDRIYISNEGRGASGNYINNILIYNYQGDELGNVDLPAELVSCLDFVVLPDLKFALLDNIEDKVYIIDNSGLLLKTVDMINAPTGRLQNVEGVVAGNSLIISENGNSQLLKIDLENYNISIFRDLSGLPGNNINSIDYNNGRFYVGSTDEYGRYIYSFIEGQPEELIATIPSAPSYLTSIKAFDNYIYVCINYEYRILKIDISTGEWMVFYEAPTGTFYPEDIEGINLSSFPDPVTSSLTATEITITGVTLNGIVNANDITTTVTFEYWTENGEISNTPAIPGSVSGADNTSVSSKITGLDAGTTYYFRIKAESSAGITYSDVLSFTTYKFDAIADIDGNYYSAVEIGDQIWMGENLKVTHYADGSDIPYITDNALWEGSANIPAFCWPSNDPANKDIYGALYNWHVVNWYTVSTGRLCPDGWHVPTDEEWTTLALFLDPTNATSGDKLKEAGTTHWSAPNTGTNESGFTALPGGSRDIYGYFSETGPAGYWWTSTLQQPGYAFMRSMHNNISSVATAGIWPGYGMSVRCIKDAAEPIVTTAQVSSITSTTATSGGYISTSPPHDYTDGRGVCWSISPNPTIDNGITEWTEDGSGTGSFVSLLTGLQPGTTYYVRAYGMNMDAPTFVYGNQISFTTDDISLPTVTTTPISHTTPISASSGGEVTSDGGADVTIVGVCWSKSPDPEKYDNHFEVAFSGTGSFTCNLSNLDPNTLYYVRAYASNSAGTAYGNQEYFTTDPTFDPISFNDNLSYGEITDIDGNVYKTLQIGSQIWMAENLKTITYNDGSDIPLVTESTAWSALTTPGYCWYKNDEATYKSTFGALYNWHTVNTGKLCPAGWHVPSDGEWTIFENYLIANGYNYDGTTTGNYIAKAMASSTLWNLSTQSGAVGNTDYPEKRNATGFTALPGGSCASSGEFLTIGVWGFWWTTTQYDAESAQARIIVSNNPNEVSGQLGYVYGLSVRCVENEAIVVTNTADSGPGSLREALEYANSTIGVKETITFNIPGDGPFTIQPLTILPEISDPVVIDGYSQPGAFPNTNEPGQGINSVLLIEIDGSNAGEHSHGLIISTDNCIIKGLVINRFFGSGSAIYIQSGSNNKIEGNFLGTNASGISPLGNNLGVQIDGSGNYVGGTTKGSRNLISGNNSGILLGFESHNNVIQGNLIGTDLSGENALPNVYQGINSDGGHENIIGGTVAGAGNIISGNNGDGIFLNIFDDGDPNTTEPESGYGNIIQGNFIGLNVSGSETLGNIEDGIKIEAHNNIIGGSDAGSGNVISGNKRGIWLFLGKSTGNAVQGNLIGTDPSGTGALANTEFGIHISDGASGNTIGPDNIISGNGANGIHITHQETTGNNVIHNIIGTNPGNAVDIGNGGSGIAVVEGATDNVIGPGNVVSSNEEAGIVINNTNTSGNRIIGNLVGTTADGMYPLGNGTHGIHMNASGNTIGGTSPEDRNIISANGYFGLEIGSDISVSGNKVFGNFLGTDITGDGALLNSASDLVINNSSSNIVGGMEPGARNVIGSMNMGNEGAFDNQIIGNYIGLKNKGNEPIENTYVRAGIHITNASNNTIGPLNIISGVDVGIHVIQEIDEPAITTTDISIIGNYIGTTNDGNEPVPNRVGIQIENAHGITVGGLIESERNIISGNNIGLNITGINANNNIVSGNYIGTTADGKGKLGNTEIGVLIREAPGNIIGGLTPDKRNIISGNTTGIELRGLNARQNMIVGNYVGTDITGSAGLGNVVGISVANDAFSNLIGGVAAGSGNLIAYNNDVGILLGSNSTSVKGNEIHGHGLDGIFIEGSHNVIGGTDPGSRNFFHENHNGVRTGSAADHNIIEGNYLGTDKKGESDQTDGWEGVALSGSYNLVKNNLISGYNKGHGIYLQRWNTETPIPEGNSLEGNIIGMNASQTAAIPNQHGITINTAMGTIIYKNIVAGNHNDGIDIASDFFTENDEYQHSVRNLISQNSVYSNGQLGIDLDLDFVTDNDEGDTDDGANNRQNFPVIDSLKFDLGAKTVFVGGSLESTGYTKFTVEFFASKVPDNLDYAEGQHFGEGQTYLGSAVVTTDGYGKAAFDTTFTHYSSWGDVITATATDPDGNTSEFSLAVGGLKEQILSAINQPFYYKVNKDGVPNILDDSDITAVDNAFKTWTDVAVADIEFISSGTTTDKYASATDHVNLVSFMDDRFPFPPGVLAIAAKTLKVDPAGEFAEIIDADIVFNPVYVNHPEYNLGTGTNGYFDIQSVTTHEIGHVLGLIHTGIVNSTMFFMIGEGTSARDLEPDDIAWAGYRYPGESETTELDYHSNYGSISGNITYGYNGDPVGGALVYAINTATRDSIHAYSDAWGNFEVPVPAPASYNIYIEPLDGDVHNYPLKPCNISVYVYCNTNYTDYPGEFCSLAESAEESADDPVIVQVNPGSESTGYSVITNLDLTSPKVLSVLPEALPDPLPVPIPEASLIDASQIFKITFSEPVNETTLTGETCYLVSGEGEEAQITTGNFKKMSDDQNVILFAPAEALKYNTLYTLSLTTGITDLKNNTLDKEYAFIYKTGLGDIIPPAIKYIVPEDESVNVFITSDIRVFFSEPMDKESVENGFTLSYTESGSAATTNVSGSYTWKDSNTELAFTPLSSIREGTDYTVTISGSVVDLAGISMGTDSVSSFTTVPQANPEILYIGPADLQSGVTIETPVVVDFSEPINPNTVNSETFMLKLGDNKVSGSFEFLNDYSRVVFRPATDLQFSQTYTVTLTTEIEDVSDPPLQLLNTGNTTFTTAAAVTDPHIDYLEPVSGVVGALVTITGSGFDPDPAKNNVVFNGIQTQAVKASLTSVVTKVPVGTISGPVSLVVNGTASDNSSYFFVIPQSLDPCDDVIANVSTGSKSRDVDITADASTAYVTNPDAGTVSVIDMKSFLVKGTISVGSEPFKIDINPAGTRAYVTNFGSHNVSVVDLSKNSVINTISVGINPYGVIVSPDGRSVYVANYSSEYVSVIDSDPVSGGFDHVVANISTGTKNTDIAITADAGYVLVAGNDGLKIVSIDPSDLNFNTVISNVSTGTRTTAIDLVADAGIAFVATEDGSILIVDIYPGSDMFGAVIANVSTGSKIGDIQISGDAMFVYVSDPDGNKVTVYKLTYGGTGTADGSFFSDITLTKHNTIDVGDTPAGLVIDAQNQQLLVVNSGAVEEKNLTVIKICCGPIAPATSIGDLIITIQTMINQGIIKQAIGSDLINQLNSALYYLSIDKTKQAINRLNSFIVKVKDLMKSRQITNDQGQPLVDAAEAIIADLKGTKSVDIDYLITGTEESEYDFIPESALGVIYPNPFSESITINFEVAESMNNRDKVTLKVYDISGRLVSTVVNSSMQPGRYSVIWDGSYDRGGKAPYGTYILLFRADLVNEAREIVLMK